MWLIDSLVDVTALLEKLIECDCVSLAFHLEAGFLFVNCLGLLGHGLTGKIYESLAAGTPRARAARKRSDPYSTV